MNPIFQISWINLSMELAGSGLMIAATVFFVMVWTHFRLERYRSIGAACFATLLYTSMTAISKITFIATGSMEISFEYYRIAELTVTIFLCILPYFLASILQGPSLLRVANRILSIAGLGFFFVLIFCAYRFPLTFLSSPYSVAAGGVEAKTGILYIISQGLLGMCLIYAMILICIDYFLWESFRPNWTVPIGLFLGIILNLSAVCRGIFGHYLDPFGAVTFSRSVLGQLSLAVCLSIGYFNHFLKQAKEVSISRDALKESRKNLHAMLYTDALTGLPNRRNFLLDLRRSLDENRNAGILLLDLDDFMEFNECFGDDSGDEILKSMSAVLSANLPKGAALYRMGGDEFSVIIPDGHEINSMDPFAHRIREITGTGFKSGGKTHSFGVAIALVSVPEDGDCPEAILSSAYSAMHEAKESNSICRYSQTMKRDSLLRISTIQHLREDLRRGFFHMVYQPIHDREGKVSSVEALLRWETKTEKIPVGPDFFIPLLEAAGLMPEMGELIFRLVIKDFGKSILEIKNFPLVSINLSPQQLKIDGLGVSIYKALTKAEIPLSRIQFEVTESAFLDHAGVSVANLSFLRSKGSPIAMDDFGTGYSNLGYLRNLPIDKIKVDQSFISNVPGDNSAEGLLKALFDIGKSYNMSLVAEGVETDEQRLFLHKTGFDEFQGFLYSQPLPCNDFLRYIEDHR